VFTRQVPFVREIGSVSNPNSPATKGPCRVSNERTPG
jgi:hypothetical protein